MEESINDGVSHVLLGERRARSNFYWCACGSWWSREIAVDPATLVVYPSFKAFDEYAATWLCSEFNEHVGQVAVEFATLSAIPLTTDPRAVIGFIETLRRLPLTGHATRAGRDVLGCGTEFTTQVRAGDTIRITEPRGVVDGHVVAIVDDSHLVLA